MLILLEYRDTGLTKELFSLVLEEIIWFSDMSHVGLEHFAMSVIEYRHDDHRESNNADRHLTSRSGFSTARVQSVRTPEIR